MCSKKKKETTEWIFFLFTMFYWLMDYFMNVTFENSWGIIQTRTWAWYDSIIKQNRVEKKNGKIIK